MATTRRGAAAAPARRGAAAAPARRGAAAPGRSSGYTGAQGRAKMAEAHEHAEAQRELRSQQSHAPFRYYMKPGEQRETVIVDDAPNFFRYEHNLQSDSGRWDIFTPCINEHANCPVCSAQNRTPYFAMYLTCIDLTPYVNRDDEEIPWSKKLLVVKPAQQKKIMRLYERHGSMRGMILSMSRDGDKDATIGNDIEFVEFMPEDELLEYETDYTDKEGKVHDVIGHEVFDYDELFPEQTEEMLQALVGGGRSAGSRGSNAREFARDNSNSRRPTSPARRGAAAPADDWEAGEEAPRRTAGRSQAAEDDAPPARRSAVAPSRRPAPAQEDRPARRAPRAAQEDFQDDDIPFEEAADDSAPPPRAAAPAQGRRAAPARRAAQEEQDDPPQRGNAASSMAARRQQLRQR